MRKALQVWFHTGVEAMNSAQSWKASSKSYGFATEAGVEMTSRETNKTVLVPYSNVRCALLEPVDDGNPHANLGSMKSAVKSNK